MPRILVVGSVNVDIVVRADHLPVPGETVTGGTLLINHGGKGANQAVAARRLGAEVRLLGCVGEDAFGAAIRQDLAAQGLGLAGLASLPGVATGTGLIVVDTAGRNQIAVASEANSRLSVQWLSRFLADFAWAEAVLCQLEVPLETVLWTLRTARQYGAMTLLNPAPAQSLPAEIWPLVDYLTPNAIEAAHLSGLPAATPHEAASAARALRAHGVRVVLVTLGEQGAVVEAPERALHVPTFPVVAVDTTAAGDAFHGALAVALATGQELESAVRFAHAAAALTCTRPGAQLALPYRHEVEALLA